MLDLFGRKIVAAPLHYTMEARVGRGGKSHTFLTSTLDGVEWSSLRSHWGKRPRHTLDKLPDGLLS